MASNEVITGTISYFVLVCVCVCVMNTYSYTLVNRKLLLSGFWFLEAIPHIAQVVLELKG